MKAIDRKLLFHLVDVVWGVAHEDDSVPSTDWSRAMIQKAIERRRAEKYSKQKLNLPHVSQQRELVCLCSDRQTIKIQGRMTCTHCRRPLKQQTCG